MGFIDEYGYESEQWSDAERGLWDDLTDNHPGLFNDEQGQFLFHEAMFDTQLWEGENVETRQELEEQMKDYLDGWDIDFDQDFDWDTYGEWYDSVAG